jgi:hypothetical protein
LGDDGRNPLDPENKNEDAFLDSVNPLERIMFWMFQEIHFKVNPAL